MSWLKNAKALITTAVAIIGGLVVLNTYWDGWTVTEAEADQAHQQIQKEFESYQEKQYRADKADRLDRFQREIDRIDYQLISENLTDQQRMYLANKRRDIERKIACVERDEC